MARLCTPASPAAVRCAHRQCDPRGLLGRLAHPGMVHARFWTRRDFLPVFALSTTAAAIVFTWLYNSTGGSLPLVILAHTLFDLCTTGPWSRALFTLPQDQRGLDPFNILTVVMLIMAVGVVFATDASTLTRRPADAMSPISRGSRVARD